MRKPGARGYTLIELVAIIVILGILAAVALPNLLSTVGVAHAAVVSQVAGAFRSAVTQAQIRYLVSGLSGIQDNVPGFANGGVDFNAGQPAPDVGNETRQPFQAPAPQAVRQPMEEQRMKTRIAGNDLPGRTRRRVPVEYHAYLFTNSAEHRLNLRSFRYFRKYD